MGAGSATTQLPDHDEDEFTEGNELDRKWKVVKQMIGRRLSLPRHRLYMEFGGEIRNVRQR
jgi:hypothetical protein